MMRRKSHLKVKKGTWRIVIQSRPKKDVKVVVVVLVVMILTWDPRLLRRSLTDIAVITISPPTRTQRREWRICEQCGFSSCILTALCSDLCIQLFVTN